MLKYSLHTIKRARLRTNLYTINKNGPQTNTSKFDDKAFRGGAHTQKCFRKLILNLTGTGWVGRDVGSQLFVLRFWLV